MNMNTEKQPIPLKTPILEVYNNLVRGYPEHRKEIKKVVRAHLHVIGDALGTEPEIKSEAVDKKGRLDSADRISKAMKNISMDQIPADAKDYIENIRSMLLHDFIDKKIKCG